MPLYNFKCENGHVTEEILSFSEQDDLVQKFGKVLIKCAECNEMAEKEEGIQLTGNLNKTWAEEVWGKQKNK